MKCNIAKDLLPLYFDGLCSGETEEQLEAHIKECESCRRLKQSLEQQEWNVGMQECEMAIAPLKKIRKKVQKKNIMIALCLFVLLVIIGITIFLTYGQITKTGLSFELIYDAIRFQSVGKQFADGNIEPLYEMLSDGYLLKNDESSVVRLAYPDTQTYDADMKEAIMEKYHQYFDGKSLTYQGIETAGYLETAKMGWNRTLSISLKFEGTDGIEYYLIFYKTLNGQYLVDDYFGDPYLSYEYESGAMEGENTESGSGEIEVYHTRDTLFSCLSNQLSDFDLCLIRHMVLISGQRALQGDKTLAENGQTLLNIISEQDLADDTDELRKRANEELDKLAELGYYVTDFTWNVKEYDTTKHLYRYQVNVEFTNETSREEMIAAFDCYRIGDQFLYIPESAAIYGRNVEE